MKKYFFIVLSLFCFSCIKTTAPQEVRTFGAIKDDPALVAKVPVIMSADYYHKLFRTYPTKKPKPIDTTVVDTIIVNPPTSTGYQIAMPPVTSQGTEGNCVAFAAGYYTRSAEEYYHTNASAYNSSNIFSPEYLFDLTTSDHSTCSGSSLLNTYNFLQANGDCTWQTVPYSSSNGCILIPTDLQIAEAANYKITSYAYVATADVAAMKSMLSAKHPLVISFMVDSYFYSAGAGFIWKSTSGVYYGLHAVAIVGFDDSRNAFKIINSWGTGWGDSGYSWIDYNFLPTLCSYAYVMNI